MAIFFPMVTRWWCSSSTTQKG